MKKEIEIDKETKPNCKLIEEKFDWGEPYTIYKPIFDLNIPNNLAPLEFSIEVFGRNNFKNQLLKLYNKISNFEEHEYLENFNEEVSNRKILLKIIDGYLIKNENLETPWNKYGTSLNEYDYISIIEEEINKKLVFVKED